jgi:hypothetical protein
MVAGLFYEHVPRSQHNLTILSPTKKIVINVLNLLRQQS